MNININNLPIWDGKDFFHYKDCVIQQNKSAFVIFEEFFKYQKFDRIIEIGTAGGGWALFLKECANKYNSTFVTYDIKDYPIKSDAFKAANIDFRLKNVFEHSEEIIDLITKPGRVALFCDGGNKIEEFNLFSKYLKPNDFILAHDYAPNTVFHFSEMRGKHWDWCEISDEHIKESLQSNNLIKYLPNYFNLSAWICTFKNE